MIKKEKKNPVLTATPVAIPMDADCAGKEFVGFLVNAMPFAFLL